MKLLRIAVTTFEFIALTTVILLSTHAYAAEPATGRFKIDEGASCPSAAANGYWYGGFQDEISGAWRTECDFPRHLPTAIGLSVEQEAACGDHNPTFKIPVSRDEYEQCIETAIDDNRKAEMLTASDDTECKSFGLTFGTAAYAECREHLIDRRTVAEQARVEAERAENEHAAAREAAVNRDQQIDQRHRADMVLQYQLARPPPAPIAPIPVRQPTHCTTSFVGNFANTNCN